MEFVRNGNLVQVILSFRCEEVSMGVIIHVIGAA